jgi:hypothetical protein
MVRRWSRLTQNNTPIFHPLNLTLNTSQLVNLYLIYDFSTQNTFTSAPLRRKLMRRKHYSGGLLKLSTLHKWSKEYRFNKLIVAHLTNTFLFKTNFICYNFVKNTKFNPSQYKINENCLTTTCISKISNWSHSKNFISRTYYKTFLSSYTPKSTVKLNLLQVTPEKVYANLTPNTNKSLQELQSIMNLTPNFLFSTVKNYYKIFTLLTLNNLFKSKSAKSKN